jgi:hypothetical protein
MLLLERLSPCLGTAVRQAIREINSQHAREFADQAVRCRTSGEARELLAHLRSSGGVGDTRNAAVTTAMSSKLASGRK